MSETAARRVPAAGRHCFVTTIRPGTTPPGRGPAWRPFDPPFVGLTGTAELVAAAQRAAGARPARPGSPVPTVPGNPAQHADAPGTAPHTHGRPLGYAVQHTNVIFAYDVEDRLPVLYPSGTSAADLAADLPLLAKPGRDRPAR